jgi:hypothetical protein
LVLRSLFPCFPHELLLNEKPTMFLPVHPDG